MRWTQQSRVRSREEGADGREWQPGSQEKQVPGQRQPTGQVLLEDKTAADWGSVLTCHSMAALGDFGSEDESLLNWVERMGREESVTMR